MTTANNNKDVADLFLERAERMTVLGSVARNLKVGNIEKAREIWLEKFGEQLDEAARVASDQIRARPLASAGMALGVGVLIGMLLASRR